MFWGTLQLSSALATLFFYKLTKSPFAHGPPHSGSSHPRTTLTQNGSLRVLFFCPFLPASVGRGPGTTTPSRDCFLRLLLLTLLLFASSLLPSPPTLEQPPCAPGPLPPPQASLPGPAKVPRFSQRLRTSPGSIQRALSSGLPWKDGCCVSFPVCGVFLFLWFASSLRADTEPSVRERGSVITDLG